jgi:hypothetical protein
MNEALEKKLTEDFPLLFRQSSLDMTQTCMCWGCEHGDGWEPIIRELCENLSINRVFMARVKGYEWFDELKVKLHNVCRKIERMFGWRYGKLYMHNYRGYHKFPGWHVEFTQIKEKFGTLRVYYDIVKDFEDEDVAHLDAADIEAEFQQLKGVVRLATSIADRKSEITCERCGSVGKLRQEGWIKCLCENCNQKKNV